MAKGSKKPEISEERLAEIREDARSGRNWASELVKGPTGTHGPGCVCGAGQRFLDTSLALTGTHGRPNGMCHRHPGGSVWGPPPGVWDKIRKKGNDEA
jgi:hypothetical protein